MPTVERTCVRCGCLFHTEARYLKRGRGKYCSRTCQSDSARDTRWRKHHDDIEMWFWDRVDSSKGTDACWPWRGRRMQAGYGRLVLNGVHENAHRVAYRLARGEVIPVGLFVCHRCDNPPCCNPDHLFLGTHQDNVDDMMAKGRKPSGAQHWTALRAREGEDQ